MVINNINRLSSTSTSTSTSQDTLNALFSPSNWRSMFIGKAGAGKTYTLRQANDNYMIELLAPSNLAAWQLGGKTLCKFLGLEELTPDTLLTHPNIYECIEELLYVQKELEVPLTSSSIGSITSNRASDKHRGKAYCGNDIRRKINKWV